MSLVSSVNVRSQIGQEGTIGAGTSTTNKLNSMQIVPSEEISIREIMAAGRRFNQTTVTDKRWSSFSVKEDDMTYTEHLYCLENLFGAGTKTTPSGATDARQRVYDVSLSGAITPKTWVHQWGDSSDNVNQTAYGLLTDYGETWDRDSGVKQNGTKGQAQLISTGNSFTASPGDLANVAIAAGDFEVYLDTTGAGLGTTQITREINTVDWSVTGMKDTVFAADRSEDSYASHVDLVPKTAVKFTAFENSTTRTILANLIAGNTYFLRLDGQSSVLIDNDQVLTISGSPTGGTFTLTYKSQTTGDIDYNATAADVATALKALSTIGDNDVSVSGSDGGPWTVSFTGLLANDDSLLTHTDSLTGGTDPALGIVQHTFPFIARREMAIRYMKSGEYSDAKGVYTRDWEFVIVEDSTWAKALLITSQTGEDTL